MLNQTNSNYFTFTAKEEKKQTIILKGLNIEDDPEELRNELLSLQIQNVKIEKVLRFATDRSNNITLPIV